MNERSLSVFATTAMGMRAWPDGRFPPSPYYRFLQILAQNTQPLLSVELGVCGGGGSFHMAMGWPKGKVIGIDITNDYPDNISYILDKCDNYEFKVGDSVGLAQSIRMQYGKVDLLFIDTTHTYEQTVKEFNAWRPYLSDKAIVCFDDLDRVEMDGFWEWLPQNKMRLDILHHEGGFGVWWV